VTTTSHGARRIACDASNLLLFVVFAFLCTLVLVHPRSLSFFVSALLLFVTAKLPFYFSSLLLLPLYLCFALFFSFSALRCDLSTFRSGCGVLLLPLSPILVVRRHDICTFLLQFFCFGFPNNMLTCCSTLLCFQQPQTNERPSKQLNSHFMDDGT